MVSALETEPRPRVTRPIAGLLRLLADGAPLTIRELVEGSGLPRRIVTEYLRDAGMESTGNRTTYALDDDQRAAVATQLRELDQAHRDALSRVDDGLARLVAQWLAVVPRPSRDLDHVQATPHTIVDRVRYLVDHFDVTGTRFCFLGDHDLTAPALAVALPQARIAVADIDDRVLAQLSGLAPGVTTAFADLRVGVPPSFVGGFDVVFTDPPYTEAGVGLFASRAVDCLDPAVEWSRVVIAYGHSRLRPDLGQRVQTEILHSGLVIDELRRGFNAYTGAEALGSRSDLYVCQPAGGARRREARSRIYTHGAGSVESQPTRLDDETIDRVHEWAGSAPLLVSGLDGSPELRGARTVRLDTLLTKGIAQPADSLILDLRGYEPTILDHVLVAGRVRELESVTIVVNGPVVAWERRLGEVSEILDIVPGSTRLGTHALGQRVRARDGDPVWRHVLARPHGVLRNLWREALIAAGRAGTKNEARAVVAAAGFDALLELRPVDLPGFALPALRAAISP